MDYGNCAYSGPFTHKGFESARYRGEVISTHQKIYSGRSTVAENQAQVRLENGSTVIVTCEVKCPRGQAVEIIEYKKLIGGKAFYYEGIW